jgi:hypothetical protein
MLFLKPVNPYVKRILHYVQNDRGDVQNDRGANKKKTGPVFPDLLSQGFLVDEILYIYII